MLFVQVNDKTTPPLGFSAIESLISLFKKSFVIVAVDCKAGKSHCDSYNNVWIFWNRKSVKALIKVATKLPNFFVFGDVWNNNHKFIATKASHKPVVPGCFL